MITYSQNSYTSSSNNDSENIKSKGSELSLDTIKRIEKDLKQLYKTKKFKVIIPNESELNVIQIQFKGPKDSVYEKSYFRLRVEIPDGYPYKSPSVCFMNKIYHPNVEKTSGSICLDVLNTKWSPLYELKNIVEWMVPGLLKEPNPDDPFNTEAASLYENDIDEYNEKVQQVMRLNSFKGPYREKFYPNGYDSEKEEEDHPYYESDSSDDENGSDEDDAAEVLSGELEKVSLTNSPSPFDNQTVILNVNGKETPFLEVESSGSVFLLDSSNSTQSNHTNTFSYRESSSTVKRRMSSIGRSCSSLNIKNRQSASFDFGTDTTIPRPIIRRRSSLNYAKNNGRKKSLPVILQANDFSKKLKSAELFKTHIDDNEDEDAMYID